MATTTSFYVRLPELARDALLDLAEREWRDPRDQAGLFVVEGLRRAGMLPEEQTDADRLSDRTALVAAQ